MAEHPIEGLMVTAMNSIQDMIDVNTIIGEPIETSNNIVIIPISKVSFGFAAGGSEFKGETVDEYTKREKEEEIQYRLPFGGGSGAGASINPVAFLVVQNNNVKLLPVNHSSAMDKLLDYVPDLVEKANSVINKQMQNKKEEKKEEHKLNEKIIQNAEKYGTPINNNKPNNVARPKQKRNRPDRKEQPEMDTSYEFEYDETPPDFKEEFSNEFVGYEDYDD
ncbi:MAG: GerW family sporulation protein [Clostridia bacterium]